MTDRKKTTGRATSVRKTVPSQPTKARKTEEPVKVSTEQKTEKAVKASARETTTRREPTKQESKTTVRRDAKGSTGLAKRLRNNRIGRFLYEAYYELRYKVTWPTFREARNMTMIVIALSTVIGIILSAADLGLHRLFLFIIGAQ
jgi:preprotein translocase SecE subunit